MKVNIKKIKECRVKMTVEVEPQVVEGRLQQVLKDFQKAARLPGFREGKAPFEMIEKKFAKEAEEETLKSLIPEIYHQSIRDEKVSPVSLPSISDIHYERGKKLTFSAEFDESPEVSIKNYKGIKLSRPPSEVTPQDVEAGMHLLLESRAQWIPVSEDRAVAQGDFIVADIEVWENGVYRPGRQGVLLSVEPSGEDDFFEKMIGARPPESREITRNQAPHTRVTLRAIKEKKLPVMDEEFAKSFGQESVETLREAVRKDIAARKHAQSVETMKQELFSKLLNMASFAVPEGFVEKQRTHLLEEARRQYVRSGGAESRFEEEKAKLEGELSGKAKDQVKLYFILRKVADLEGIEEDEIEIERRLHKLAAESRRPLEEIRQAFEVDLRESMRESKTIDFLIANAQFIT